MKFLITHLYALSPPSGEMVVVGGPVKPIYDSQDPRRARHGPAGVMACKRCYFRASRAAFSTSRVKLGL